MFVNPAARGQGIGMRLLMFLEDRAIAPKPKTFAVRLDFGSSSRFENRNDEDRHRPVDSGCR
jgi:GNAT superfamily N-acetyltransferase